VYATENCKIETAISKAHTSMHDKT